MNEKNKTNNNLFNFTVFVRVGDINQQLDMAIFAALCNPFLYDEICEVLTQSSTCGFIYSGYANKTRFTLKFHPKKDS